jgi:hypothetical protein
MNDEQTTFVEETYHPEGNMAFIKVGNRILNTYHIASVELHYEQAAFNPPDIDLNDPDRNESTQPAVTADLVRVHFSGGREPVTFYHDDAKALREYFNDPKNIVTIEERGRNSDIGFH